MQLHLSLKVFVLTLKLLSPDPEIADKAFKVIKLPVPFQMSVSIVFVSLLVFTAMMGSITSTALNSPCPELFQYDSSAEAGKWSGTVTLLSDSDLHGIWLRLLFDRKIQEIRAVQGSVSWKDVIMFYK